MYVNENVIKSLEEYKAYELQFHRDLMTVCRKYINNLSIVSILGIFDIVKRETIDLEQVTKEQMNQDKSE